MAAHEVFLGGIASLVKLFTDYREKFADNTVSYLLQKVGPNDPLAPPSNAKGGAMAPVAPPPCGRQ